MTTRSLWAKLDQYPPVLVRLLARHPDGKVMSDTDIARQPGLTLAEVRRLSLLPDWHDVSVPLMRAFVHACRMDFCNREQMRNANRYINRDPKFRHLVRDPNFPAYREMLRVYYQSQTN